jgi:hypothetical protein
LFPIITLTTFLILKWKPGAEFGKKKQGSRIKLKINLEELTLDREPNK